MIPLLARLLTFWIPLRGPRLRLRNGFIRLCYGLPVRLKVKKAGPHLHCAGPVHLTKHTELADHVCFNGAWASGNGRLVIGRYFHSGDGLRIFTRNHNYDHGEAIPYDATYIAKDVVIGDFVWIGARVILLRAPRSARGGRLSRPVRSSTARSRRWRSRAETRQRCSRTAMRNTSTA